MAQHQTIFKRSALYLALTSSFTVSNFVVAQQQNEMQGIERIEVTGSRRSSSVQEAPLNITALDADIMADQNITQLSDIARWVPGLTIPDQGGYYSSPIIVRGLNTNASNPGSDGGTVATYVGEIPLDIDMKILDVERVEVLIGPQGTLYGAGTLGGAIRYLPKKPILDETSGSIYGDVFSVKESSYTGGEAGFIFNQPLVNDKLGLRVAFNYLDDPGYIDYNYLVKESGVSLADPDWSDPAAVTENLASKKDINHSKVLTARTTLRWKPTNDIDVNFTYHYQKEEFGGRSLSHYQGLSADNPLAQQIGKYDGAYRFIEPRKNENSLLSLEVVADLGFAELTSATGKSSYDADYKRDQTDLLIGLDCCTYEEFPEFSAFTRDVEDEKVITQEIRLVSKADSTISWIVGAYYNNNELVTDSREYTPGYGEYWYPGGADIDYRSDSLEYIALLTSKTIEKAIFGELSVEATDALTFTFGTRFYQYNASYKSDSGFPLFDPDFTKDNLELSGDPVDDSGNLFKFNIDYQINRDLLTYATISEGYRIGGSNGIALCEENAEEGQQACASPDEFDYDPDTTTNYELGFKSTWYNNKLHFNTALFLVKWNDAQVDGATEIGQEQYTSNAASAESKGIEISTRAIINNELSAYATYAYTQAKLTSDADFLYGTIEYEDDNGDYQINTEQQAFYDGKNGDRLPGSPETQFSFGLTYSTEVFEDKLLDINYGLTYQSDIYTKVGLKADGEVLPSYALSNISARLSDDAWSLIFYIDNMFDKYAVTSIRRDKSNIGLAKYPEQNLKNYEFQRGYGHYIVTPRTIGLRVTYNFDL